MLFSKNRGWYCGFQFRPAFVSFWYVEFLGSFFCQTTLEGRFWSASWDLVGQRLEGDECRRDKMVRTAPRVAAVIANANWRSFGTAQLKRSDETRLASKRSLGASVWPHGLVAFQKPLRGATFGPYMEIGQYLSIVLKI